MNAITNPHSPGKYRVNGLVVNMPEFEKAFFCKAGQPMTKRKPLSHLVTDISTSCLRGIERSAQLGHFCSSTRKSPRKRFAPRSFD
jgi:hypothetical protein